MSRSGTTGAEIVWKWVIIGNSGVGKTSILSRLCDDEFTNSFISTIGIDFKLKKMTIGGKSITIQLWDTAGQERFGTITKSCYRGCNAAILVYDVCSRKSFQDITKWVHEISMNASDNVCTMLLGNKSDFDVNRDVETEEAADLASRLNVPFLEVSAKNGHNIQKAFTILVEAVLGEPIEEKAHPPPKPASKASEAQQQRMGRLTKMFSWASSKSSVEEPSTILNPNKPPQMPQGRHNSIAAVTPIRSARNSVVKVLERSKSTTEVLEGNQRKTSRSKQQHPQDRRRKIHVGDIPDDDEEDESEADTRSSSEGSDQSDGDEAADRYNDTNNNDDNGGAGGGGGTPIYVFKRGNNPRFNSMKKKVISRVSDPDIIKLSGLKSIKQQHEQAGSGDTASLTRFDRSGDGGNSKCSC